MRRANIVIDVAAFVKHQRDLNPKSRVYSEK